MATLRSFANYGTTTGLVYPFTIQLSASVMVFFPVTLVDLDGYAAGAGWLQFFDTTAPVTNGAVPFKSFNVAAAGPLPSLFQTIGPVQFKKGMVIGFSSTEATFTALATSFDVHGEVEDYIGFERLFDGLGTITSNTGSGITVQLNHAERKLWFLAFNNNEGMTVYPMLTNFLGTLVITRFPPVSAGVTQTYDFGNQVQPTALDTATGLPINRLLFALSSTPTVYTPTGVNNSLIICYTS